jgi:WD40 repeat protein
VGAVQKCAAVGLDDAVERAGAVGVVLPCCWLDGLPVNVRPDGDASPARAGAGAEGGYSVDARGGLGVQVGEGNTQIIYTYNRLTSADGLVAPPPLVSFSGVIDSPYRGLSAFEERDAAFFFGREEAAARVLERMSRLLDGRGLLVVSGASGAGKSSLLQAGVLPRLRGTGLAAAPAAATWRCLVLTPTRAPLNELAVRVARLAGADAAAVRRGLESDPAGFALTARQAALAEPDGEPGGPAAGADQPPGHQRLLLLVDQFEQVFTQCPDEGERQAFIAALCAAAGTGQGPGGEPAALVVLGVRADFEARCAGYPELAAAVQDRYLVTPMTGREMRMAITEPAKRAGQRVDDDLTTLLLDEVRVRQPGGTGAGVLPLLSHALDQSWRSKAGEILTLEDYERTGGIEGAVAASAERAYGRLTPGQQAAARQVFTRLTATSADGIDTADRSTRAELAEGNSPAMAADVEAVLEAFAAERLLTLAADSVEISHEVLLTAWPLLRDTWLAQTHADRIVRTRLRSTAAEWARGGRDASYLYPGSLLQDATEAAARATADPARHAPLSQAERDFLRASGDARHRRARRRQGLIALLSAMVLGLASTAVVALVARQDAVHQRQDAISERDNAIFSQVTAEAALVRDTQPSLAAQLDLVAERLRPGDPAAYGRLVADTGSPLSAPLVGVPGGIASAVFSRDWRLLATGGDDGVVRLWDLTDPARPVLLGQPLTGTGGSVVALALSLDGKTLASGGDDGVRLWDLTDRTHPAAVGQPITGKGVVNAVAFSPDGHTLAITRNQRGRTVVSTLATDGDVRLWDITNRARPLQMGRPLSDTGVVNAVTFSPDGHTLATGGMISLKLWDVTDPSRPTLLTEPDIGGESQSVYAVAFSHDGRTMAAGESHGTVRLWDTSDRAHPTPLGEPLTSHVNAFTAVGFSPDGNTLASVGDDGVQMWNLSDRTEPSPLGQVLPGQRPITAVAFSPDGRTLASAGTDGVSMWTEPPVLLLGSGEAKGLMPTFTPNGRTLATAGLSGTRLWNLADPARPVPLGIPLSTIVYHEDPVAFSPDGRTLVMGDINGTRLWDTADPSRPTVLGKPLPGTSEGVDSVAFSPDGLILAIAPRPDPGNHVDGGVQFWDLTDRAHPVRIRSPINPAADVTSMAFSQNGRILATGGDSTYLWDASDPTRLTLLGGPFGPAVQALAFSPNGRTLATGGGDNRARLWDLTGLAPAPLGAPLSYSGSFLDSVAFSPDGKTLAVGGDSGTQLWNLTDPTHPTALGVPLAGNSPAFSPDGHTLATVADNGTVQLWETDASQANSRICHATGSTLTRQQWQQLIPELPYDPPCP